MEILYADEFVKQFKHLPKRIQQRAVKQEEIFKENPLHPSLNTEKLSPKSKQLWSIRIDRKYRIIFRFNSDQNVYFMAIGEHDWVYKYTNRL
jgi:mRNA-degrading endonuclease RelE of RelBE toxin-antitoxin system